MSHAGRNWWAILGKDQTISQERGGIKTLTWASPILLTVESHTHNTQREIMTKYTPANTKSSKIQMEKGRRSTKQPLQLQHAANFLFHEQETVFYFLSLSCVQIPKVTLGNGQLMTHNHKPVVHMRTMSTMVLILLRPAFEILNQCLKAFRLFMHNLTPTTAIHVRRIFGEDESGRVEVLNPRPFCKMMKERR